MALRYFPSQKTLSPLSMELPKVNTLSNGFTGNVETTASVNRAIRQFVLDTSAILTYFQAEAGDDQVIALFQAAKEGEAILLIPFAAAIEIYYMTLGEKGQPVAEERFVALKMLPAAISMEMEEAYLLEVGRLKAKYPISFADALIAAVATQRRATLVHKDPELLSLQDECQQQVLPLKRITASEKP